MLARLFVAFAALCEAEHLERKNRQHARHQIEDQAAEEGQHKCAEDACAARGWRHAAQRVVIRRRWRACGVAIRHRRGSLDEGSLRTRQLRRRRRRHGDTDVALHDRVADAVFEATLVFRMQLDCLRQAIRAREWNGQFDLVEVDSDRAEMFVGMRHARRPLRRSEPDPVAVGERKRTLVAIKVIALGHRPARKDRG